MYPADKIEVPQIPENYLETLPKPAVDSISRRKEQWDLDPKLARQAIQAYYASITFADAQVGRILKALDETGLAENTIVVFTSDHGYHMGEHGHYQKTTLFENATRVPLIIAGPGVGSTGKTATTLAEMVDIYPTLADLTNLTPPKSVAGKSLLPALSDPSAQLRDSAFSQLGTGYSIRTSRYRYTEWGEEASQGAELYDRSTDPEELVNLIDKPDQQNTIQELSTRLRKRIAEAQQPPAGVKQIDFENDRRVPQRVSR
jgi:arylsulfatase A-like enzyme